MFYFLKSGDVSTFHNISQDLFVSGKINQSLFCLRLSEVSVTLSRPSQKERIAILTKLFIH